LLSIDGKQYFLLTVQKPQSAKFYPPPPTHDCSFFTCLKVVCNENLGGLKRWHTLGIGFGPWRIAIDVLLAFNIDVVFYSMWFRFRRVMQSEEVVSLSLGETRPLSKFFFSLL